MADLGQFGEVTGLRQCLRPQGLALDETEDSMGRLSLVLGEQVGFSRYLVPLIVVPDRFSLYLVLLVRLHSVPFFLLFYFFYREKTKIILKLDSILLHPQHQWIGPPLSLPKLCAPFK